MDFLGGGSVFGGGGASSPQQGKISHFFTIKYGLFLIFFYFDKICLAKKKTLVAKVLWSLRFFVKVKKIENWIFIFSSLGGSTFGGFGASPAQQPSGSAFGSQPAPTGGASPPSFSSWRW